MEKKSERLEVRLGYEEKQDFTEACENQGDTPSGAIRRFQLNGEGGGLLYLLQFLGW